MRSQKALRPGVAILAAALLALAWIPAAAAPPPKGTTVTVDETLSAVYMNVDNPCTTGPGMVENITLQGGFHIVGSVTFYSNGSTTVNLGITSDLGGTDTASPPVSYTSNHTARTGPSRWPPGSSVTGTSPFKVIPQQAGVPYFWLWVRFVINPSGDPNGNNSTGMVTFSPVGTNGYDSVLCGV